MTEPDIAADLLVNLLSLAAWGLAAVTLASAAAWLVLVLVPALRHSRAKRAVRRLSRTQAQASTLLLSGTKPRRVSSRPCTATPSHAHRKD